MTTEPPARFGILVSRDLFFGSKVSGTANQLGLRVEIANTVERAVERSTVAGCSLILFDLESPQESIRDLMNALNTADRPPVVAFGSHVHTQWLEEARAAGCDDVMPRSKFTATLPDLLRRYLSPAK